MNSFNLALRGTAKELQSKEIGTLVVTMFYPAVLSYFYETLGEEKAVKELRKLGSDIMDDFLKIYTKERKDFTRYIKDFFQEFYNSKVTIEKLNDKLYHVFDNKCVLCSDITVEGLPFHYCIPYSGSIQRLLEILCDKGKIPKYKYTVNTIASKGLGNPSCIHAIKLED
ncbi:MAG: hypothetical protein ACTSRG_14915 [Candidatus Helarchaeota archaeon]